MTLVISINYNYIEVISFFNIPIIIATISITIMLAKCNFIPRSTWIMSLITSYIIINITLTITLIFSSISLNFPLFFKHSLGLA